MDLGLSGKRVLVTASSGGIGFAIAERFLEEGAQVMVNGRNQERLNQNVELWRHKYGSEKVYGFCGDITDSETILCCKKKVEEIWNGLDILVPNLGTGKPLCSDKLNPKEWERFFRINLFSAVELIQNFRELLAHGKKANLVLISSIVAYERMSAPYGYAAAKNGVRTLANYLSGDLAEQQIRVNTVVPGNIYFKGGRWEELKEADAEGVQYYIDENVPMKRFGTPEEIADAVVFLASERASFITGAELVVDGGQKRS